jgi:hypothetical protein
MLQSQILLTPPYGDDYISIQAQVPYTHKSRPVTTPLTHNPPRTILTRPTPTPPGRTNSTPLHSSPPSTPHRYLNNCPSYPWAFLNGTVPPPVCSVCSGCGVTLRCTNYELSFSGIWELGLSCCCNNSSGCHAACPRTAPALRLSNSGGVVRGLSRDCDFHINALVISITETTCATLF